MRNSIRDPDEARNHTWLLVGILALAAGLRLWGLPHDLPFSYFGDELHLMKRSMALGSGDLNPHWFNKPGFLMYLLLGCYGLYFAGGWMFGRFESIDEFAAHFLTDQGPFLLIGRTVVFLAGMGLVLTVYLIGRRGLRSSSAGLVGALVVAVLPSLVATSQSIKADVPCSLFVAISVFTFLQAKDETSLKGLALSAIAAGAAMGTKYCGIILIAAYLIWEIGSAIRYRSPWRATVARGSTLLLFFLVGFFITSPYNFLDSTWVESQWARGRTAVGMAEQQTAFSPDSRTVYQTGIASWPEAAAHFVKRMHQPFLGGSLIQFSLLLGVILGLLFKSTRSYSLLALLIFSIFFTMATVLFPFRVSARHFIVLAPLLAPFVGLAVAKFTRLIPAPQKLQVTLVTVVGLLLCLPTLAVAIRHNRNIMRLDGRTLAHSWIVENLSTARVLVEDEGPVLNPSAQAAERMQRDLSRLDPGPFTRPQEVRLELLRRYPPSDGIDIDRLGHPWWVSQEIPAEDFRQSEYHTRVGNPLVPRLPLTLEEYRQGGIDFVVTNSQAQRLMRNRPNFRQSFPSFARFYDELESVRLVQTFDPEDWGGKGPQVWIYDIRVAD